MGVSGRCGSGLATAGCSSQRCWPWPSMWRWSMTAKTDFLVWEDDSGKEWKVTRLPTEMPEGRDEQGHPVKPQHGSSYKARVKKRLGRNPKKRDRRRL